MLRSRQQRGGVSMTGGIARDVVSRAAAVCLAVLATLSPAMAHAQGGGASTTGSISGKVADTSSAVLPGVTVNATSPAAMGIQTTVTDGGGNYRFPALPPGTYTLTFELPGFNTDRKSVV